MTKRISALDAKKITDTLISKAEAKKEKALKDAIKVSKLWGKQSELMLFSAIDGKTSYELNSSLINCNKLIDLGFEIEEVGWLEINEVAVERIFTASNNIENLNNSLKEQISNFINISKHGFLDKERYKNFIEAEISQFIFRERISKRWGNSSANNHSLINYLNSSTYTAFKIDGAWNDFLSELIFINKTIYKILNFENKEENSADTSKNSKVDNTEFIITNRPNTKISIRSSTKNILSLKNKYNVFVISWGKNNSEEIEALISANCLAWISSTNGQKIIEFIFAKIKNAYRQHLKIVKIDFLFKESNNNKNWEIKDKKALPKCVHPEIIKEFMIRNGYKSKVKEEKGNYQLAIEW